mgnify:CR=1 FL=1
MKKIIFTLIVLTSVFFLVYESKANWIVKSTIHRVISIATPGLPRSTINVSPLYDIIGGLVSYWTLDGNSINWATGVVSDVSGVGQNGNQILMSTTTSPIAGRAGQGLFFDGVNDFIRVPNATSLKQQNITVSFWTKPGTQNNALSQPLDFSHDAAGAANWVVLSQDATTNRNYLWAYHDGTAYRPTSASGVGVQYTTGVWQHIAYTKSGTTVIGYKNGVATWNPTPAGSATAVYGASPTLDIASYVTANTQRNFKGEMDEIRVYNRALSASEIKHLYELSRRF